jgi:hypothetical protein
MGISKDTGRQRDYVSYLLRMWRDSTGGGVPPSEATPWRASLQSPHTGDLVGFARLNDLFEFLWRQAGSEPAADDVESEG